MPYVSSIVDLEGGGTVKGNLVGIDPDPENAIPEITLLNNRVELPKR